MGLLCVGFRLHGLRDLGDLYEARTACHCMVGIAIRANVAGNGSRMPRIGCNAGAPGMGVPLTVFQQAEGDCDRLF